MMTSNTCPECQAEIEMTEFPFGKDVQCPDCSVLFETDWDETDEGPVWWIVGRASDRT